MLDDPVCRVMQHGKLLKASPRTFVLRAARMMASRGVGAVLVMDAGRLVGIVTERDVVYRVVAAGLETATTRLAEVMTPAPDTIDAEKPLGHALVLMQRGGFRHLPVLRDGKPVGIISARSALDPDLEEFAVEKQRRTHFAGIR